MAKAKKSVDLDLVFAALAHAHRRAIIDALSLQPCSISQLAALRGLSLPAIHKHVKVLEAGGLIIRKKVGRTNFLALDRSALLALQEWAMKFHAYWGSGGETLENYVQYLTKDKEQQ